MLIGGWITLIMPTFPFGLSWLGNPLLFAACWFFLRQKYKRSAWFSFTAFLVMLEFLLHGD
jgi:hypothetical protein